MNPHDWIYIIEASSASRASRSNAWLTLRLRVPIRYCLGSHSTVMKTFVQFHKQAEFLREASGSTDIKKTLLKALKGLKLFDIPHYVRGGFAVQEHGYPRFTVDVDIIVPDFEFARERLSLNGFKPNSGSKMTLTDRETKVEIDLLPGGNKVDPGPLAMPKPTHVSDACIRQASNTDFGGAAFFKAVYLHRQRH
jgi:hypothetical protein